MESKHLSFLAAAEPAADKLRGSVDASAAESGPRPRLEVHSSRAADARSRDRVPVYGSFYGIQIPPFDLTPDPRFLFLAANQREALSNLRYALSTPRGFSLLTGDAGTGKTTLVRAALAALAGSHSRHVLVSNPTLTRAEFYELLIREFGLSAEAQYSKTTFLAELRADVESRFAAGGLTGIIIDEAQSLPYDLLEEIRLLGNIETDTAKLLNIVLAGQPELAERLNEPSLRQLKQRITLRCELTRFSLEEASAYVAGRIRISGGLPANIFTREAVVAIHKASSGNPRTINVLCDNVLITGFALQVTPIPVRVVEDVCRDFDVNSEAPSEQRPFSDIQIAADPAPHDPKPTRLGAMNLKKRFRFSFFGGE